MELTIITKPIEHTLYLYYLIKIKEKNHSQACFALELPYLTNIEPGLNLLQDAKDEK